MLVPRSHSLRPRARCLTSPQHRLPLSAGSTFSSAHPNRRRLSPGFSPFPLEFRQQSNGLKAGRVDSVAFILFNRCITDRGGPPKSMIVKQLPDVGSWVVERLTFARLLAVTILPEHQCSLT
jgi:hypothetical protein